MGFVLRTGSPVRGTGFWVTSGLNAALGAKTPWKHVRCVPLGGTRDTSRFTRACAVRTRTGPFLVVPVR